MRVRAGDDELINTDPRFVLKCSGEYEVIEDFWMPTWVEWTDTGHDGPDLFARIEVRNGKPELVRLEWSSNQNQREIRPRDLRSTGGISGLVEVLYAGLTFQADPETGAKRRGLGETDEGDDHPPAFYAAQRFLDRQRRPEGYRQITPKVLKAVADVYARNVDGAPTAAVAKAFGVKARMASRYVDRARQAGHLPPTTQGKKKA